MKIVTSVVNNPDFIELQYKSLKKFVECEYEFVVFNDAKNFVDFTNGETTSIRQEIHNVCKKYDIECIDIINENHKQTKDAALRCADACNYILKYQIENPDEYLLMDSDMFLIDYFNPKITFNNKKSAVVLQKRGSIDYFWNGLVYLDFRSLTNTNLMNWNPVPGTDVGGSMMEWLLNQNTISLPEIDYIRNTNLSHFDENIYFIRHLWSCTWNISELHPNQLNNEKLIHFLENDPRNIDKNFFCEIYENCFLHYRAGGNWRQEGIDFHRNLTQKLKIVFEDL